MMMGFGFFGLFLILFFFIITIVAALAAISWLFPRPLSTPHNSRVCIHPPAESNMRFTSYVNGDAETPMDILKRRYARGEITREEYETMKKDILA